jgi:bacteriocin biosynthesis cyclodehydratase domain-containing protein
MIKRKKKQRIYILRPDCFIRREKKDRFSVFVNNNGEVIECDEMSGNVLDKILPLLDGVHTEEEMAKAVIEEGLAQKAIVEKWLEELYKWGLVVVIDKKLNTLELAQAKYFSMFSSNPINLQKKLTKTKVGIIANDCLIKYIIASLSSAGIKTTKVFSPSQINFFLKKPDFLKGTDVLLLLLPSLEWEVALQVNALCIKNLRKLFFANLNSHYAFIGPYVVPPETACLGCLANRIEENEEEGETSFTNIFTLLRNSLLIANFLPFLLSSIHLIIGYLSLHILGISDCLVNHQLIIDYKNVDIKRYFILKSPNCPYCGNL